MKNFKYLLFILLFSFNTNYTLAQCVQQRIYSCAASLEGAIYLRDFNTRLKLSKKDKLTGHEWSIVMNKGTYYRFALCTPRGREDDVELRLFDSENAEFTNPIAVSFLTGIGTRGFDFYCTKSGVYNVSVRFKYLKNIRSTCGVGLMAFIGRKGVKGIKPIELAGIEKVVYYSLDTFLINEKAENLYLANTGLRRFPRKILKLINLKELYIGENDFRKLNKNIYKLENLKYIDLSYSPKLNFDKAMVLLSKLEGLEELGLSYNRFKYLPNSVLRLNHLRKIHLPCNAIFDYKGAGLLLKRMYNLKGLKLNSTDYELLNRYLSEFNYFEEIDISGCYLQELPSEIFKMSNLKSLDLSNNRLITIPPNIIKLKNLTKLNLSNNLLTKEIKANLKLLMPDCEIIF